MANSPMNTAAPFESGPQGISRMVGVLGGIFLALGLVGNFLALGGQSDAAMIALPLAGGLACGVTLWRILRMQSDFILVPIVIFIGQVLIVSAFGPLVHSFGAEQTLDYLAWRPIAGDMLSLAKALAMSYCAIGLILSSAAFFLRQGKPDEARDIGLGFDAPLVATVAFLMIGAFIRFLIVTPTRWGLVDTTLPGVLVDASMLFDVGIGLLCYLAYSTRPMLKPVFWLLLTGSMAFSVLDFAKLLIFLPAVLSLLFYFLARRKIINFIAGVALVGYLYSLAGPLTAFARSEMVQITGDRSAPFSMEQRISVIETYLDDPEMADARTAAALNPQAWWTRINYTQQQSFAMREHDAGRPGESLKDAWMLFIPRALWQDKPIIYPPGREFFRVATGRDFSFMAATIYGDMYWQFGWIGVIGLSPLIGGFYAWLSLIAYRPIVNREFVYLPVVLLGMLAALQGAQQYLLNGIIATVPVVIVVRFICSRLASVATQSFHQLGRA
jgi:hypothetical protein